jgi:light-regulated signal transduction histidine kinase (bacteriophytochrome)
MNERVLALFDDYVDGLTAYATKADELELGQAYGMGRAALVDGLGVLEMSELHHEALGALLARTDPADRERLMGAATVFFNELLSPFEMTLRGYRTANHDLQRLNEDLQRQKRDLESANRELETFSYSASHDLRSPLAGVQGLCNLLLEQRSTSIDQTTRRYLKLILDSTQKMLQLIDDLLNLARANRAEMQLTDVDLSALANGICDRLHSMWPDRDVQFIIAPGAHAQGDARLLGVLLDNLLRNAWKFTARRAAGLIEFGWRAEERGTVFHVRDNGAGFDMAQRDKLFRAFSRLHSNVDFEGTGIGLTSVQRVVHRHGGDIWAQGAIGMGATFYFTLPGARRA